MNWVSLHVFYHDPVDGLLVRCVRPLVSELRATGELQQFFFVRYLEGGPHCRLRVGVPAGSEAVVRDLATARLTAFMRDEPSTTLLPPALLSAMNDSVQLTEMVAAPLPPQPNNSVVEVPYSPETQRYGGPDRLDAAEWHFGFSSTVAFDVLTAAISEPRRAPSLKACAALQFMLSVPQAFGCTNGQIRQLYEMHHRTLHDTYTRLSHTMCEDFRDGGRAVASWVRQAAERRPPVYHHARELYARLIVADEAVVDRQRIFPRLMTSYVHMFLNRLGLFLDQEARLSWALSRCLQEN